MIIVFRNIYILAFLFCIYSRKVILMGLFHKTLSDALDLVQKEKKIRASEILTDHYETFSQGREKENVLSQMKKLLDDYEKQVYEALVRAKSSTKKDASEWIERAIETLNEIKKCSKELVKKLE